MSVESSKRQIGVALQPVFGRVMTVRVNDVQRVGVPGLVRVIGRAQMRRTTVEDHERACRRFRCNATVFLPRRVVKCLGDELAVRLAVVAFAERTFVRARNELHTAVLERRIFQGKPETDARLRLGVDVRRVLVADHFAADVRWFEYVH